MRDVKDYRDNISKALKYAGENKNKIRIAAIIVLIVVAVLFYGGIGGDDEITVDQLPKDNSMQGEDGGGESSAASGGKIFVDISGEIKNPGVYEVAEGTRLFEVVEMAGGLTEKALAESVNQAETVTDGQKIVIPDREGGSQISGQNTSGISANEGTGITSSGLININNADSTGLQEIPGVGPATAEKIINYRNSNGNFKSKEEIKNVSGIGDKTYEKIKDMITV